MFVNTQRSAPFLAELCRTLNATSAWLLQYHSRRRVSIVVGEYWAHTANASESLSDLGEEYPQSLQPRLYEWIHANEDMTWIIQIDNLAEDSLARLEYIQDNVKTVLYIRICHESQTWGFIEV